MDRHFQVSPEIFDRVQVRSLAGTLKDIHRVVPSPLLLCRGCVLRVIGPVESPATEPPPQLLSAVRPDIDRCEPFQIMSDQMNLPQVDSKTLIKVWKHLKDDPEKRDAPEHLHFSVMTKGVNTYVSAIFLFFFSC